MIHYNIISSKVTNVNQVEIKKLQRALVWYATKNVANDIIKISAFANNNNNRLATRVVGT